MSNYGIYELYRQKAVAAKSGTGAGAVKQQTQGEPQYAKGSVEWQRQQQAIEDVKDFVR